jgi:ubiquitin C-terminal hydrolase
MTLNNPNLNNKADYIISTLNDNKTSNWLKNTQGVILNIIQCNNCNYISYNFEPFNAIQLDLPDNNNDTITLTTLLRNYLKSSINKDEWKCEKCNKCSFYTKSHKLWKLPNVLIFLIKRYVNINKKNAKPIDINKNINIKKGCILSDDNLEASYNFSSIGMHIGNLDSGHYYAICKDESNNKFILYNDLNIRIYNEDNTKFLKKNNDAYMVVYSI